MLNNHSAIPSPFEGKFASAATHITATAIGGAALLSVVSISSIGLVGILPSLFVVVSSLGFVMPNATTLALSGQPHTAGSSSALLGVLQYAIGDAVAPLVGAFGIGTAFLMAVVIAALGISALVVFVPLGRSTGSHASTIDANP